MSSSKLDRRATDPCMMPFFSNKPRLFQTGWGTSCRQDAHSVGSHLDPDAVKQSWLCSSFHTSCTDTHKAGYKQHQLHKLLKPITATPSAFGTRDDCWIPQPVLVLFVYLTQQGVTVGDLFRRPGNITQIKEILQRFSSGQEIRWNDYNVYTVANVAKKLLLSVPGGLFGPAGESELLATASADSCASELNEIDELIATGKSASSYNYVPTVPSVTSDIHSFSTSSPETKTRQAGFPRTSLQQLYHMFRVAEKRIAVFRRVIDTIPPSHRQLSIIMFGLLHQLVFQSASSSTKAALSLLTCQDGCARLSTEQNSDVVMNSSTDVPLLTLAEGVVKSVAGSLFHTCVSSVIHVEQAAQVLRSLVVYFPAMGDSVMRFYLDALADRLSVSSAHTWLSVMNAKMPVCILCPKSDHSTYFDQHSLHSGAPVPCPVNLFQAASRLFCLSSSDTSDRKAVESCALSAVNKSKFRSRKSSAVCTTPNASESYIPAKCTESLHVNMTDVQNAKDSSCCLRSSSNQLPQSAVIDKLPDAAETTGAGAAIVTDHIVVPQPERYVPTLRRNQSRYRSLHRRQMENLSRRAEWFLGPTVLPNITLTPTALSSELSHYTLDGIRTNNVELVVTSTVSLLDLDDAVGRQLGGSSGVTNGHLLGVLPPRLLFTASTGELEQQELRDSSGCDACMVLRPDSNRQRLLSVGSCFEVTSAESFASVHSAPSPDLHQSGTKGLLGLPYSMDYYSRSHTTAVSITTAPIPSVQVGRSSLSSLLSGPPPYSSAQDVPRAVTLTDTGNCIFPSKLSPRNSSQPPELKVADVETDGSRRSRRNSALAAILTSHDVASGVKVHSFKDS